MELINKILVIVLLLLCSCKNQAQNSDQDINKSFNHIYGQWEYVYDLWGHIC